MKRSNIISLSILLLIFSNTLLASIEDLKAFIPNIEQLEKTANKFMDASIFARCNIRSSIALITEGKFLSVKDKAILTIENDSLFYIKENGKLTIDKDGELILQEKAIIWNDGVIESYGKSLLTGRIFSMEIQPLGLLKKKK